MPNSNYKMEVVEPVTTTGFFYAEAFDGYTVFVSLHNNIARVYEFDGHLMYEESVSVFLDNYKLLSQLSFDGEFE